MSKNSQDSYKQSLPQRSSLTSHLDFCVWVLKQDGLHVPPFIHHQRGEAMLSSLGFNAPSWESWVKNITIKHDPRLDYNIEQIEPMELYIQKQVEQEEEFLQRMEEVADREPERFPGLKEQLYRIKKEVTDLRSLTETRATYNYQKYRRALTLIEQLPEHLRNNDFGGEPPDLWWGSPAIQEKLSELWQQYQQESTRLDNLPREAMENWHASHFMQEFDAYMEDLDFLKFYLVVYPETVEYPVPPGSVLKSFQRESYYGEGWEDSLRRGALALVEKCRGLRSETDER